MAVLKNWAIETTHTHWRKHHRSQSHMSLNWGSEYSIVRRSLVLKSTWFWLVWWYYNKLHLYLSPIRYNPSELTFDFMKKNCNSLMFCTRKRGRWKKVRAEEPIVKRYDQWSLINHWSFTITTLINRAVARFLYLGGLSRNVRGQYLQPSKFKNIDNFFYCNF